MKLSLSITCLSLALASLQAVAQDGSLRLTDAPRFSEHYLTTPDGVRLYARVYGSGPDTVITSGAAHVAREFARLAKNRTLIVYDSRGRGASDTLNDPELLGFDF